MLAVGGDSMGKITAKKISRLLNNAVNTGRTWLAFIFSLLISVIRESGGVS